MPVKQVNQNGVDIQRARNSFVATVAQSIAHLLDAPYSPFACVMLPLRKLPYIIATETDRV